MLKCSELRQLNADELLEKVRGLKKEHFELRMAAKTGKLEKHHRLRELKRDIARLLTVYHEVIGTGPEPSAPKPKRAEKARPSTAPEEKKAPKEEKKAPKEEKEKKSGGFFGVFKGKKGSSGKDRK
jgi:large subunit ribosomal protein L29